MNLNVSNLKNMSGTSQHVFTQGQKFLRTYFSPNLVQTHRSDIKGKKGLLIITKTIIIDL